MLTEPFLKAIPIIEKIEQHNHQAYFVGGCVRDLLLKQEIKDIDITTSAPPEVIQAIFDQVIPVGIEHGTVIVRHDHTSYEVTTFRVDGTYSDQRHPDHVQFINQINEDLKRRDFTMNALAMDRHGKIIDLFHGRADIENKLIRTVGSGDERFNEDPLRIIRGLRFASQLGFRIEEATLSSMINLKHHIEAVAIERITNEMTKLFTSTFIRQGLDYFLHTRIYDHLPLIKDSPKIIQALSEINRPFLSFSEVLAFFHVTDRTINIQLSVTQWKCSRKVKQEAQHLIDAYDYYEQHGVDPWLVYKLPAELYHTFINLMYQVKQQTIITYDDLMRINRALPIRSRSEIAITGHELIHLFPHKKTGPWIHSLLQTIEKNIVFHNLTNTTQAIKEWITCNPPETN